MSETQLGDYWYEMCLLTRNELTQCEGDRDRLRAALTAALQRAEQAESSMNLAHEDLRQRRPRPRGAGEGE